MTNEELAERIKAGEIALMADLWENCRKLLLLIMNRELTDEKRERMERCGSTVEDLEQELYFAFCTAVKYYDPAAGYKFNTYLKRPVLDKIRELTKTRIRHGDALDSSVSFDQPIEEGSDESMWAFVPDPESETEFSDVADRLDNQRLRSDLDHAIDKLPERQGRTIRKKYFFGESTAEIAKSEGVSGHTINKDEAEALQRLREAQELEKYREDIIQRYAYRSGLGSFRANGFRSSVEIATVKILEAEERVKKAQRERAAAQKKAAWLEARATRKKS